jgi:hypothetical protein
MAALVLTGAGLLHTSLAQQTKTAAAAAPSSTARPANVDQIIRSVTAKEAAFRQALNQYVFKRDAVIQTIGMGGQVTGEYHRVSYFTFDDSGTRFEKIVFFPMSTLQADMTAEDLEDLGGVNPFALEASKLGEYNFTYVGKERIDELDLYVFDVTPKVVPDAKKTKERYFTGRIWVDDHDLQIVKSRGKGIPETKINKFPIVETYREQIDGRYWFPTYAYADDELVFDNGSVLHIRMQVKYTEFKRGRADVKIIEVDDLGPDPTPTPTPAPPPAKPKP